MYRASPSSAAKNIINLVSVKCTCPWRSSSKAFFLYCLPPLPLQAPLESCTSLIVTLFVLSFFSSQHWAGALSLLCSSSCSRASRAPSNLLNTVWLKHEVWDLLLGHETTSFLKTQHNPCFPYGAVILFAFLVCLDEKLFLTDSAIRFLSISIYRQSSEEGIHRAWTPS